MVAGLQSWLLADRQMMTSAGARVSAMLQIRPGEGALVRMMTGMMLAAFAGMAIAAAGVEALFYARFGVEFLPLMYIILGLVAPLASLGMTGLLARVDRRHFYLGLSLGMALLLLGARFMLLADLAWFYAALWLTLNVFWMLLSLGPDERATSLLQAMTAGEGDIGLAHG